MRNIFAFSDNCLVKQFRLIQIIVLLRKFELSIINRFLKSTWSDFFMRRYTEMQHQQSFCQIANLTKVTTQKMQYLIIVHYLMKLSAINKVIVILTEYGVNYHQQVYFGRWEKRCSERTRIGSNIVAHPHSTQSCHTLNVAVSLHPSAGTGRSLVMSETGGRSLQWNSSFPVEVRQ